MCRKSSSPWFALALALVLSVWSVGGQGSASSGVYEIVGGTYIECCGFAGDIQFFPLPNESQQYVRLTLDPPSGLATMTILGQDLRTIFAIVPCPEGSSIPFRLWPGSSSSGRIIFHADPGPPPNAVYWSYLVSNSVNRLQINGILGTARPNCLDVPTRFTHSNVVAVLIPPASMRITEFSEDGVLLFIQGRVGWVDVVEASTDLVSWTPISTNVMPATLCPVCPYILVRDTAATNQTRRFYRCFERP